MSITTQQSSFPFPTHSFSHGNRIILCIHIVIIFFWYIVFEINSGCYIYQNLCFWKLGKWKLESRIIPHFRKIWFYIYQTYDIWNKWLEYTLEVRCRVMFLNTDPEEWFWLIIVKRFLEFLLCINIKHERKNNEKKKKVTPLSSCICRLVDNRANE